MDESNKVVQGFWHGAPLTTMERLSMQSFVKLGHEFHLYVYDGNMPGVPDNVHLRDASEIVSLSEAETFRCPQQLSDFFRIVLLYKRGGWHSDLDNCCLRPLSFDSDYVFYRDHDETTISLALSKAPAGSPMLRHCIDYIQTKDSYDRSRLAWQEIGADLVLGAVEHFQLQRFAQPGYVFDPVSPDRVREIVDPEVKWNLEKSYSLHLFHAVWNGGPADKTGRGFDLGVKDAALRTDAKYPDGCLYEQLKQKYLQNGEA